MRHRRTRLLSALAMGSASAIVAAGLVGAGALPEANATPSTTEKVTITPNPSYSGHEFEGWGTSLVWFANATGGYPDELRQELFDKVFSAEGMNLNIARYNIGGGNASDVPNYFRYGANVEGWWAPNDDPDAGPLSTYAEREAYLAAWDATDESSYNWDADQTQRWWVQAALEERDDMVWEAFSNSPPYFMTNSGFVTGNFTSTKEQVSTQSDAPRKFATYLAQVVAHMEEEYGIEFRSVDPFNEPCTGYWGTTIPAGQTWPSWNGKTQEGAQICAGDGENQQQSIIAKLSTALEEAGVDANVAANDETNPQNFNKAWAKYSEDVRQLVDQINVHTYWSGGSYQTRDIAKAYDKPLWMSEVGGDYLSKTDDSGNTIKEFDPVHFSAAVGFAQKVISDLKDLEPNNYVFWQEIEDYYNMEKVEKLNWGSIFIDFDCNDSDETSGYSTRRLADAGWSSGQVLPESAKCKVVTNSKYNAMRNFTHYIEAGSHLVGVDDTNSVAAVTDDGVSIVHVNATANEREITIDFSKFAEIAPGATVTPIVTTEAPNADDLEGNALVEGSAVPVGDDGLATLTIPAMSVVTFVVDGVSGVADDASIVKEGESVQIVGVKSGLPLTSTDSGLTIDTLARTSTDAKNQTWVFERLDNSAVANAQRYLVKNANGLYLAATSAGTELRDISAAEAETDPESVWILNSTNATSFSLLNTSLAQVLDVNGESTAAGAKVGTWSSSNGAHQLWTVRTVKRESIVSQSIRTSVGTEVALPETVIPIYAWGQGDPVPVTWDISELSWDTSGTVTIKGSGEDMYGVAFEDAELVIDIGPLDSVDPESVVIAKGSSLSSVEAAAPTTVTGRRDDSTGAHAVPVTWDFSTLTAENLSVAGQYEVQGSISAADNDGRALNASLVVIVTESTETNVLTEPGVTAAASFTENSQWGSYSPSNTINGNQTEKGWSTWGQGRTYTSDYLEYTLPEARTLETGKVFFYLDGSNKSYADTVRVEYWNGEEWVEVDRVTVDASSKPVTVEFSMHGVTTTKVRVHMDAPNYLCVSEVEIYSKVASASSVSDLAVLRVNGTTVPGFSGTQGDFEMTLLGSAKLDVVAIPLDRAATVEMEIGEENVAVTVVSADKRSTSTFTIQVRRQVDLQLVTIAGEPVVGQTLTAQVATDPDGARLVYQWNRNGEAISGAQGDTYTPESTDVGKSITVDVLAQADGYADSTLVSSAPVVVGQLGEDSSLSSITVDGKPLAGFTPDTKEYATVVKGSQWPVIAGQPADDKASVAVIFDEVAGVATLTVTAENGTSSQYLVTVERVVDIQSINVVGDPVSGGSIEAAVRVDPQEATLTYTWLVDGTPLLTPAATSIFMPTDEHVGKDVSVIIRAEAEGFTATEEVSEAVSIRAADSEIPDGGGDDSDPGSSAGVDQPSSENSNHGLAATGAGTAIVLLVFALICGAGVSLVAYRQRTS